MVLVVVVVVVVVVEVVVLLSVVGTCGTGVVSGSFSKQQLEGSQSGFGSHVVTSSGSGISPLPKSPLPKSFS